MKKTRIGVISLIAVLLLIAFIGMVYADTGVTAVPEIQGLSIGTSSNVQGTVTETDSGAWTITNDPFILTSFTILHGPIPYSPADPIEAQWYAQLTSAGGSFTLDPTGQNIVQFNIPESLMNTLMPGSGTQTWQQFLQSFLENTTSVSNPGIHSGVLDPGQVQYTAGYSAQYSGVSGQQTFAKSMALSTANTIADQSNIKANTNIQFIAIDTGRATNSENFLLDGASQAQNSSSLILCPFANANPGIIPAFCNIEQAGSAFDTTLTSTVTSADTRFVGKDAIIPVVLNYNINAEGITLGNQSSPMIGSVSAYLKVHVQEARNESIDIVPLIDSPFTFTYPVLVDPTKSEDLVYSETSTASGLINKFSKSMSYTSQAFAVQAPVPNNPILF